MREPIITRIALAFVGALAILGLTSCGDEAGGGGQCGGVDETGVCLFVTEIAPFDRDADFTQDVDVNFVTDCDGDPGTFDPEDFTEHFADVALSAAFIQPVITNATRITVTNMTILYTLNPNTPFVGPAIARLTTGVNIEIPVGGTTTASVSLMNFQQKDDFTPAAGFVSAVPFTYPSYTVTYIFSGVDDFGRDVDASGRTEVTIGAYNNC